MRQRAPMAAALVLLAACGGPPAAEQYTKAVVDDLVARDYGAASSRYRMYEDEVLSPEAAPAWRRAIEHSDATVRDWAVDALSRIGLAEDLGLIVARLDDSARGVRVAAASGLVRMNPDAAAVQFGERLATSAPEQVTLAAAGFVELGQRAAAAQIVRRFEDPSLPESTRSALTQPLAALGGEVVVGPLVAAALDTGNGRESRRLAAEAALAAEAEGVDEELRRLLEADDEYVRSLAATILRQ